MTANLTPPPAAGSNKTYLGVQVLRAIAAVLVVIHHSFIMWSERLSPAPTENIWHNGAAGVDIFFVISGFVMTFAAPKLAQSLSGGLANARQFLWRRLIRIAPIYWSFTALKLVLLRVFPGTGLYGKYSLWHIVSSFLFIPALNPHGKVWPVLTVGWTLNFEMFFYLLIAVALVLRFRLISFLLPTLIVVATLGMFRNFTWPAFTYLLSPLVIEFLYGVLLANATQRGYLLAPKWSAALIVAGFAILLFVPNCGLWRFVAWGLPALAIVTGAIGLEKIVERYRPGWLLAAGDASYATYLVHTFALPFVGILMVKLHQVGNGVLAEAVVIATVVSLVLGGLTHRLIELPLLHRVMRKHVERGASSAAA